MVEKKDYSYMAIIVALLIGGTITTVYLTGDELTCRTNKPIGWEIVASHDGYDEAVCPYKTKEPTYASCASFRSTGSYQRYGCEEVMIVKDSKDNALVSDSNKIRCLPEGCSSI